MSYQTIKCTIDKLTIFYLTSCKIIIECTVNKFAPAENAFENPEITDILDPALIKLVENSVEVDGKAAQYTYDDTTGELKITLDTIEKDASSIITFQVQKV